MKITFVLYPLYYNLSLNSILHVLMAKSNKKINKWLYACSKCINIDRAGLYMVTQFTDLLIDLN